MKGRKVKRLIFEYISSWSFLENRPSQETSICESILFGESSNLQQNSIDQEFNSFKQLLQLDIKVDPLNWWKAQELYYPRLALVAKKYLGIPASSATVERLFSTASLVLSQRRMRLTKEKASAQSIFRKNYAIEQAFLLSKLFNTYYY